MALKEGKDPNEVYESADSDDEAEVDWDSRKKEIQKNVQARFSYDKLVAGFREGKFKRVLVLTGAGISVSAGIPDFRSPKTGLYDNLKKMGFDLPQPESIFCIKYFQE